MTRQNLTIHCLAGTNSLEIIEIFIIFIIHFIHNPSYIVIATKKNVPLSKKA